MHDPAPWYQLAAALTALAAVFIAVRLLRRARTSDERPLPGTALARYGEIRLRDLYRLAVLLEEEGTALYLKLAELALDPGARRLCASLAEEEAAHARKFRDRLGRWSYLAPNRIEWPKFLEQVRMEGLFSNPPGPRATEREMAAFAIEQERRTVQFYRMFESSFPEAWKRDMLLELVEEEMAHEARLRRTYPDIF